MGLKDRLAARPRPTKQYALRIDDDTIPRAELATALEAGAESRVVAARTALEACFEWVTLTALPPEDMEALIAAHPPREENRGQQIFDPTTFIPALLAACVESDVTEADWIEYITTGALTFGEVTDLFEQVWQLNYRAPDPSVPKELTPTRS